MQLDFRVEFVDEGATGSGNQAPSPRDDLAFRDDSHDRGDSLTYGHEVAELSVVDRHSREDHEATRLGGHGPESFAPVLRVSSLFDGAGGGELASSNEDDRDVAGQAGGEKVQRHRGRRGAGGRRGAAGRGRARRREGG